MYIKILHNKIFLLKFVKVKEKFGYQVVRHNNLARTISNYDFVFRTKKR